MLSVEQQKKFLPCQDIAGSIEKERDRHYYVAEKLVEENRIISTYDNEEIFVFIENYYKGLSDNRIKEQVEYILHRRCTSNSVSEIIGHIKRMRLHDRNIFIQPLPLINLKNGVYDVEQKKLLPHCEELKFNYVIPFDYNENAQCPNIDKFFADISTKDQKELLYEVIAYCLHRYNPFKNAFMFYGDANTGKTTYLNLVSALFGKENLCNVMLQDFGEDKFSAAKLYGSHVNIGDDLSPKAVKNTGLFRALTGNGAITVQEKYQKSFSFVPHTKLLFATNKIPKANDEVDAYYERWILVNFPNQFKGEQRDNQLYEKLTTKEELEGLLKKCLDILPELLMKNFSYPLSVEERKTLYIKLSDTAGQFLSEKVELDTSVATTKEELYQAFVTFCHESKQPVMSEKAFSRTIYVAYPKVEEARLRKPATAERARCWLGLRYIGGEEISFTPNQ